MRTHVCVLVEAAWHLRMRPAGTCQKMLLTPQTAHACALGVSGTVRWEGASKGAKECLHPQPALPATGRAAADAVGGVQQEDEIRTCTPNLRSRPQDMQQLAQWVERNPNGAADFLALPRTRSAADVEHCRAILDRWVGPGAEGELWWWLWWRGGGAEQGELGQGCGEGGHRVVGSETWSSMSTWVHTYMCSVLSYTHAYAITHARTHTDTHTHTNVRAHANKGTHTHTCNTAYSHTHRPSRLGLGKCKVVAKLEDIEGLVNHEEILARCEAVVFSRGALGTCMEVEKVRVCVCVCDVHGGGEGEGIRLYVTCMARRRGESVCAACTGA